MNEPRGRLKEFALRFRDLAFGKEIRTTTDLVKAFEADLKALSDLVLKLDGSFLNKTNDDITKQGSNFFNPLFTAPNVEFENLYIITLKRILGYNQTYKGDMEARIAGVYNNFLPDIAKSTPGTILPLLENLLSELKRIERESKSNASARPT